MKPKEADIAAADANTANATTGFGIPTWGFYDPKKGGYKAFGTVGQGDQKQGIRGPKEDKCMPRKILVTVTAIPTPQNTTVPTTSLFSFAEPSGSVDLSFLAEAAPADSAPMMTLDLGSSVFLNSAVFLKAVAMGSMAIAASLI
jgi:hypothetical protein